MRIEKVEKDLQDAITRIEELSVGHAEHQRALWELSQKTKELEQLQEKVQEYKESLDVKRDTLIKTQGENEELRSMSIYIY